MSSRSAFSGQPTQVRVTRNRGGRLPNPELITMEYFLQFRHKGELPKGCKKDMIKLICIKPTVPEYAVIVEVDIVYGTLKAAKKKLSKYQSEIGEVVYNLSVDLLQKMAGCIVEEVKPKDLIS